MNKNSKQRQARYRKDCIANGRHFPTKGFKKKAQPFLTPKLIQQAYAN
jgi:hypothetical protein